MRCETDLIIKSYNNIVMSKFKFPKNVRRTSGLTILDGKLHAVRYIWKEGLQIKELVDNGIYRVKSGIAIEETPQQYFKSFLRGDSTGKKMDWWDDDFISQNITYNQAAQIIKKMDNVFKQIMKEEGFQSRAIHNDRRLGTEMYESDNLEELIDTIKSTWSKAYRIAYEYVMKEELPDSVIIPEFSPRYMQQEEMIDPVVNYLMNVDRCTIEVPGGSGKTKCSSRISQIMSEQYGAWKVLGVAPTVATTVQLANEFAKFYKGQKGERLMDLYFIGSVNPSDYRLLESWANIYSVSNVDKLSLALQQAHNSNRDCAFFVVNKSVEDFLLLADSINVDFKKFFTIIDEIHTYSTESGRPRMVTSSSCAIINPKFDHLFGKKLGLSATHINRDDVRVEDPLAVFNDDVEKFGKRVVQVTEMQAREWEWICDKQGVLIPIPTEGVFEDAIEQNAAFELDLYGKTEKFNPVTFVGVEGIKLLSYNNKILVLASFRADVEDIARVLRIFQDNGNLDSDFEIIEGYAECGNACVNKFNRAKRAIMIATRWIGVGADTYTCDCTLPLYNPQSRAFARQFGMRGDRRFEGKVTTFALVGDENSLEESDNRFFESLQMISNGEQLNIVSESEFPQQRRRTTGGRGNITIVRPDRPQQTTIYEKWEEIAKHVAFRSYIDEETGESLFSKIVRGEIDYTPELILELVKEQGYTKKIEWQECPIGNKYYSAANRLECMDWVVEQANLEYKNYWDKNDWDKFISDNGFSNKTTIKELTNAAKLHFGSDAIITKAREKQWFIEGDFAYAKCGMKEKDELTPDMVRQYIEENGLVGKSKSECTNLKSEDNKSSINYASQRVMKAYRSFRKEGTIEELFGKKTRATKKVAEYDLDNNLVKIWDGVKFVVEANPEYNASNIEHCIHGRQESAHNRIWKRV
jgi:superfamily II DNA or RNA helicase